jgi:hypothetical protein
MAKKEKAMTHRPRLVLVLVTAALATVLGPSGVAAQPQGQLTYAMHVTIAPAWFDPAENTGIATPFMVQEAIHDALANLPFVSSGAYSAGGHPDIGRSSSLGRIPLHYYTAPFEDIRLKAN